MPSLSPLRYCFLLLDPAIEECSMSARLLRWAIFGLMVLLSASYAIAEADLGDGFYYVKRQALWMVLADWIIVMDQGRITQIGTHEELLVAVLQ